MYFENNLGHKAELNIQEGDRVEVIVRSPLYCGENEEPEYHIGIVTEIVFEKFADGTFPIGLYVKFDHDSLYSEGDEELVVFSEIEDVFVKKYDIAGYSKLNQGMTLSVKGEGVGKIIRFAYRDGSLIPESISDSPSLERYHITEKDKGFIREIYRYGAAQQFSHYVLSKSK